ncbi:MAG: AAA family ATPase, partial [Oligoflexales bacterium]|nr:AAA family ATPase [Oligoflexales bacterium]
TSLSQALSELSEQILSFENKQLTEFKEQLASTLHPNGKIITDIAPSFELIIGKQMDLPVLGPTETQNRSRQVLVDFFNVVASMDHPLVMFMDNLQWSDSETLNLFVNLAKSRSLSHLMIIGAYRNNEVSKGHPLTSCLDDIIKNRSIHQISLENLSTSIVAQIISDTLHQTSEEVWPLAETVFQKTEGNPFFLNELLKSLYYEGKIFYDHETGMWSWNQAQIASHQVSMNIVQFLTERLNKLDQDCQKMLSLAACMGKQFDLYALATISDKAHQQVAPCLQTAIGNGIIIPLDEKYRLMDQKTSYDKTGQMAFNIPFRFQHDQIQKACRSLIDESQLQHVHLEIARLLHRQGVTDSNVVDIASHYNRATALIREPAEKLAVIRLNLDAGLRSKLSNAYQPAAGFLKSARALVSDDDWKKNFDLVFEVHFESLELSYLTGQFDEGEKLASILLEKARDTLTRAKIIERQSVYYGNIGNLTESVRLAIEALGLLGIRLPLRPSMLRIFWELILARWSFLGRDPLSFLNKRPITSENTKFMIRLLAQITQSAFLGGFDRLYPLCILMGAKLALKHGNCPEASWIISVYSAVLTNIVGDIRLGRRFGELACRLTENNGDPYFKGRSSFAYAVFVASWHNPFAVAEEWCKRSMELNYQVGNQFDLAAISLNRVIYSPGENLIETHNKHKRNMAIIQEANEKNFEESSFTLEGYLNNLRGLSKSPCGISSGEFNEYKSLKKMKGLNYLTGIAAHLTIKSEILYLHDKCRFALAYSQRAAKYFDSIVATYWEIP